MNESCYDQKVLSLYYLDMECACLIEMTYAEALFSVVVVHVSWSPSSGSATAEPDDLSQGKSDQQVVPQ